VFGVLDILNLAHAAVFTMARFHRPPRWWMRTFLSGLRCRSGGRRRPDRHRGWSGCLPALCGGGPTPNISGLISSLAMATVFEGPSRCRLFGPDISRFPQGTFPTA